MKCERGGSDAAAPDRRQAPQQRLGLAEPGQCSQQAAKTRQDRDLFQEHFADLFGCKTEREKSADFSRALFEAELKQQRHEQERRDNKKDTEAKEQIAKILRLICGFERLLANGFEAETEF